MGDRLGREAVKPTARPELRPSVSLFKPPSLAVLGDTSLSCRLDSTQETQSATRSL